jgi:hypothetical protein
MTDDARFLRLLADVLDEPPKRAPDGLLASVVTEVAAWKPGPRWRPGRSSLIRPGPFRPRRSLAPGLIVALVVVMVGAGLLASQWPRQGSVNGPAIASAAPSPASPTPSTAPTPAPTPLSTVEPSAIIWPVDPAPPVAMEGSRFVSGVTYTSDRFEVGISFRLPARGGKLVQGQPTDWCSPTDDGGWTRTSERMLVLGYLMACLRELRFIDPTSVRCGTADDHPDAATLVRAILSKRDLGAAATDQTSLPNGGISSTFFAEPLRGSVIRIAPTRPFDATAIDPDQCRIFAGPDDPVVEIRSDTAQVLVLLDIHDRLFVIRASPGGYDGPSTGAARERGYTGSSALDYLFKYVRDVRFE